MLRITFNNRTAQQQLRGVHRISLQGPIDEATAQALVNDHFVDQNLAGCAGRFQ
jgi:hypothetical protein